MHLSNKQKHQELFSCAPVIVRVLLRPDLEEKQICRLTVDSGPEPNTKCNIAEFSKHTFTDMGLLKTHFINAAWVHLYLSENVWSLFYFEEIVYVLITSPNSPLGLLLLLECFLFLSFVSETPPPPLWRIPNTQSSNCKIWKIADCHPPHKKAELV